MPDYREQILALAQNKPLLPNDVAKVLNTNMLMAAAMLSELSATKKLRVSRLKVGSSPLYFLPQKEEQLVDFLGSLSEKDRQTAEALRMNKVMKDSAQDPLTRVSLRQIGDFSRALTVTIESNDELFWKWFLVSDLEALEVIKSIVGGKKAVPEKEAVEAVKEKSRVVGSEAMAQEMSQQQAVLVPVKQVSVADNSKRVMVSKDDFSKRVDSFFSSANINIIEQKMLKKGKEGVYVIELPSAVGRLTYYCKSKGKKSITEADVSQAFVEGQLRKLPVLMVSSGELNKKAKELLQQLKGVSFQKV